MRLVDVRHSTQPMFAFGGKADVARISGNVR